MPVVATFSVIGDMLGHCRRRPYRDQDDRRPGRRLANFISRPRPTSPRVASARAVFLNDLNDEFEPWLEPLLKQAAFKGTKVVVSRAACAR